MVVEALVVKLMIRCRYISGDWMVGVCLLNGSFAELGDSLEREKDILGSECWLQ